jgi:hypothetical protein
LLYYYYYYIAGGLFMVDGIGQESISYKGKEIIFQHIVGSQDVDASINVFLKTKEVIIKRPLKSVLLLTDVTDALFNAKATNVLKEFSKDITPHVKASAAVGIVGLKKIVLQTMAAVSGRNIKVFDNVEEAKEWLATQG